MDEQHAEPPAVSGGNLPAPREPDWHEAPFPDAPATSYQAPPAGYGGGAGYDPYRRTPESEAQRQTAGPRAGGRGGAFGGGIAAAGVFLGKYAFVIFKLGKIGPTAISMAISLLIYTTFFGWKFAAGFVLLILVHEMGHLVFARALGLPTGLPIFLGPFGAVMATKAAFADKRQEAVIAIGGPLFGTLGAALLMFAGLQWPAGYGRGLLLALAYTGYLVNLFNLLPINPLDGGRVANAVTRWANVAGLVVIGLIVLAFLAAGRIPNTFLIIILLIGGVSTYQRFRLAGRHEDTPEVPGATRAWIGAAYLAMLAFAALGMGAAGSAGIHDNGAGTQVAAGSMIGR